MTFGGGGLYHMILWHFGVPELDTLCFYPTHIEDIVLRHLALADLYIVWPK